MENTKQDNNVNIDQSNTLSRSSNISSIFKIIPSTLQLNGVILLILGLQMIIIPAIKGIMLVDTEFLSFVFICLGLLSLLGSFYYRKRYLSFLNSFLFFLFSFLFLYIAYYFSGPFDRYILALSLLMLVMNLFSWVINVYMRHARSKNLLIEINFREETKKKLAGLIIIIGLIVTFAWGTFTAWNSTITIKADDDFFTTSSYWGPPSLKLASVNCSITPHDNSTLYVSNSTLSENPDSFIEGSFAYVENVYLPNSPENSTKNYCNYSAGARSYPNGTVFLSESLPSTENVTIIFKYVLNNIILYWLGEDVSNATLTMNYHGDFIYYDNIFDRIQKTYLLQLLDYWKIKFYLDIYNGIEFPHAFNYRNSIPLCYDTLNWAHGKFKYFQGISLDFEPGGTLVPEGNPGGTPLAFGQYLNSTNSSIFDAKSWYHANEQNRTLFNDAVIAYEGVYAYASHLGYKTHVIYGKGEMYESIDGDLDVTRTPTTPISSNPDVFYGIMNYEDSNFKQGRYRVYRGCHDQIALLGDRGKSILLGWISQTAEYYTNDEVGLERYIEDCLIAQAAGMEEIFHAPLYRMQEKWGDDAILRLHEALHNTTKQTFNIKVPPGEIDRNILADLVENLNYFCVFWPIILSGLFIYSKNLKNKRE